MSDCNHSHRLVGPKAPQLVPSYGVSVHKTRASHRRKCVYPLAFEFVTCQNADVEGAV